MASSLGSPEALYHAIPHSDTAVNASQIELLGESDDLIHQPLSSPSNEAVVVDSRIRWIYFVLGCAVLLPWNVVITAMPFFLSRLSNSSLRTTFASYLTTSFTASNFIFLAHATAISKKTSPSNQTRSTLIWLLVLNALLTSTTFFVPAAGVFFAFVIFNGSAQAIAGAYLQTSVIAVASRFGPPAVQAMMAGQAAVAVAVSGVQVLSAAASVWGKPTTYASDGSAEERSAFMFFLFATFFLVVSWIAHNFLLKMPSYQTVTAPLERNAKLLKASEPHSERQGLISSEIAPSALHEDKTNALRVAKLNISYEIAVAYVFLITLAVYPPITTSIRPTNPNTHPLLFSSIHFLVFNVGDFLGRYICSNPAFVVWSSRKLLLLSASRTLFIPLFLMCNVQRGSSTVLYDPIISSDMLFMLILFLFGGSNGYLCSTCMMAAPSLEHNPRLKGKAEDVDVAATVASFCLVGGLVLGSVASFAVKGTICKCNPFTS